MLDQIQRHVQEESTVGEDETRQDMRLVAASLAKQQTNTWFLLKDLIDSIHFAQQCKCFMSFYLYLFIPGRLTMIRFIIDMYHNTVHSYFQPSLSDR